MLGTTEGRFAIDHPVMAEQLAEPSEEDLGLSERFQIAIEAELSFAAGALQRSHELTAKNSAQHFDGKKERVAGGGGSSGRIRARPQLGSSGRGWNRGYQENQRMTRRNSV